MTNQPAPYSSRKFWTMMIWQTVFTVLLVKDFVTGDQYSNLTLIILGSYFAANVGDKLAKRPIISKVNDDGYGKPIE